jgi:hypothetical protein
MAVFGDNHRLTRGRILIGRWLRGTNMSIELDVIDITL